MVDSSVDVCDLMIRLLCAECPERPTCADESGDIDVEDTFNLRWSHSKLMDCFKKKCVCKREDLMKLEAFLDQQNKTAYPSKGYSYYYSTGIETAKQRLKELLA